MTHPHSPARFPVAAALLVALAGPLPAALDLSSWQLIQSGPAVTNSIPAGVSIADNGYLVLVNGNGTGGPSQAEFETFWDVTLPANTVYLVSVLGGQPHFPQIGGEQPESFTLLDGKGNVVEATFAGLETRLSAVERWSVRTRADLATSWRSSLYLDASPGSGAAIAGSAPVLVINEIADAEDGDYEFVELFYAVPAGSDTTPPEVVDAAVVGACDRELLQVVFSEDLNEVVARQVSHYSVVPGTAQPQNGVAAGNAVLLLLSAPLALDVDYELAVQTVPDAAGNVMAEPVTVPLHVPGLFANEILYDPPNGIGGDANGDGVRSASDDEFIELLNVSGFDLDLEGFTFNDDDGLKFTFPAGSILAPGQALVLFGGGTPQGTFGNSLVLVSTSALGLGNGGDVAMVRDRAGRLLIHETYVQDQSDDESLQRPVEYPTLNWDLQCGVFAKHSQIVASRGRRFSPGTRMDGGLFPGASSAIPPVPLYAILPTPCDLARIQIVFSRAIDPATGAQLSRYSVGALGQPSAAGVSGTRVTLTVPGLSYWDRHTISIDGVKDTQGTPTAPGTNVEFVGGSIVINEVLYDPPPDATGDVNRDGSRDASNDEFVELVNLDQMAADLSGLQVADNRAVRFTFPNGTLLQPRQAAVIFGGGEPASFRSLFGGALVFVADDGELGLDNSGDSVQLRTADDTLLTRFSYTTADPNQSLTLDPDLNCNVLFLHQFATGSYGDPASPGRRVDRTPFPGGADVVAGPPQVIDAAAFSTTSILVRFNEELDAVTAESKSKYTVSGSVSVVAVLLDTWERQVLLSVTPALQEGVPHQVAVSGVADLFGNVGAPNGNATIAYAPPPPVLINEILYDVPAVDGDANGDGVTSGSDDEFVELVNNGSQTVDLSGWTVSDQMEVRHTFPSGTRLAPGQPLVLFSGGTPTGPFGGAVVQTASTGSLPLGNTGDCVFLRDDYGRLIANVCWVEGDYVEVAMVRSPELTGAFSAHDTVPGSGGRLFSPGTRASGQPFDFEAPVEIVIVGFVTAGPGQLTLLCTAGSTAFQVQWSPTLAPPQWADLSGVIIAGPDPQGRYSATFAEPPAAASAFFRVVQ